VRGRVVKATERLTLAFLPARVLHRRSFPTAMTNPIQRDSAMPERTMPRTDRTQVVS